MINRSGFALRSKAGLRRCAWFAGFFGIGLALLAACNPRPRDSAETNEAELPEGHHRLIGTIVTVNQERGTLLVQHEEVPGVMPAMTMEFHVSAADLSAAREGQRIRGIMFKNDDGYHLERIWPADATNERIISDAAGALHQDTLTRGSGAYREVGERLPDFALYDQDGKIVPASRFRGKQLVLDFIYTRCPDPNMCPASTAKMMQLQRMAREEGVKDLELISITLDPEFDTPAVLRQYAEARGIDTNNFTFLTGPEGAIKDLLTQLGVQAFKDGPLVRHTLATVLIGRDGRIVYRFDGSQWDPEEFARRLQRDSEEKTT